MSFFLLHLNQKHDSLAQTLCSSRAVVNKLFTIGGLLVPRLSDRHRYGAGLLDRLLFKNQEQVRTLDLFALSIASMPRIHDLLGNHRPRAKRL